MNNPELPKDALSTFSISVFVVYGLLMRAGDRATRPLGQNSARWQVLGRAGHKPQTVSQMAHDMGTSRQSVQYTANALFKENLIRYKENPADKRASVVVLTPKGQKILTAIYAYDQEWSQQIMTHLNKNQLVTATQALNSIASIFRTHLNDKPNKERK